MYHSASFTVGVYTTPEYGIFQAAKMEYFRNAAGPADTNFHFMIRCYQSQRILFWFITLLSSGPFPEENEEQPQLQVVNAKILQ